jgi:small subunit ribosomal protein S25e
MGGKKSLSLKQMERLQARQQEQKSSKKSGGGAEKKELGIILPDPKNKKVLDELKKMKVITPYSMASRLNLRISMAKQFIKKLEQQGTVEYVSGNRNIRIYKIRNIAD